MNDHELNAIKKFFLPLAQNRESLKLSTDGALINKDIVVSSDMMIEGTHFKNSDDPKKLAQKLIRINLSDLAAMGSLPYGYILNLAVPKICDKWLKAFSAGLSVDSKKYKIKLFGGDLVRSSKIFISMTIFGKKIKKLHTSSEAKNGSDIFVTGNLGDAAVGCNICYDLTKIKHSKIDKEYFLNKYFLPEPRIKTGIQLLGKVDFCTDISDGVYSELNRISKKSNLGCVIYTDLIPLSSKLKRILKQNSYDKIFNLILAGGEDYQLLFSAKKSMSKKLSKIKGIFKIGYFKSGNGIKLMKNNFETYNLKIKSFSHF